MSGELFPDLEQISVRKTYCFDAAHFLPDHPTCGVLHGHTWEAGVTVVLESTQIRHSGMVLDFHTLDNIMEPLVAELDHKCLNRLSLTEPVLPPTVEVLAAWFLQEVLTQLEDMGLWPLLVSISVQEGTGGEACAMSNLRPMLERQRRREEEEDPL